MNSQGFLHEDDAETSAARARKRQKTPRDDSPPGLRYQDYTIAWICALPIEMAAARAVLDETHKALPTCAEDSNTYTLGRIDHHNVVIACLPSTLYGTNNAANVITNMKRTFPSFRVGLMVGIGGGVPSKADVRLGDIVVGTRVMQCDLGKVVADGQLHRTAFPRIPHHLLGTAVSSLRAKHELESNRVTTILHQMFERHPEYARPDVPDRLFQASYDHKTQNASCDGCDQSRLIARGVRTAQSLMIHYGGIASGNQIMKSGTTRDEVAQQLDVMCFEMEAAGLMDILPCLPIRGICDYSDSHKNKEWQRYAAATAAAYARELLEELPIAAGHAEIASGPTSRAEQGSSHGRRQLLLDSLRFERIDFRKSNIKSAHGKTCQWFLSHPDYQSWLDPEKFQQHNGFLWISGKPGAGKSTIMKFIYLKMTSKARSKHQKTASFFFNARGESLEKSVLGMYRSLLLQLLEGYPDLQVVLDDRELISQSQSECPPLNVLKDLFFHAATRLSERSFTCFVDALDECDEQQIVDMVQYFEDLAEETTAKEIPLRICFSSRHYPYIDLERGIRLTLENQPGHAVDMETYVNSRLQIKGAKLLEEIRIQLLEKAAGVFMWIVLVVDILNKEYRRGGLALRKRLREIPGDLSELFKDILRRDDENMEHLLLCILWILYATRPLNPKEFYHALWSGMSLKGLADPDIPDTTSVDADDSVNRVTRHVIGSSKGLAEVTKLKNPTVQFIHESVRDFLIKDNGLVELWPHLRLDLESSSHESLKQCCYSYMEQASVRAALSERLSMTDSKGNVELLTRFPFLEYAIQNVLHHCNAAAKMVPQDDFLSGFPMPTWISKNNLFEKFQARRYDLEVGSFYIFADKGYSELIRIRREVDTEVHVPGGRYKYPIFAALANGNSDSVSALLGWNSSISGGIDIPDGLNHRKDLKEYASRTPLSWAAQEGRAGIVESLLQSGESPNEVDRGGRSPLSRAAEKGHESVVRMLLETGADVNKIDRSRETPFSLAFRGGHIAIAMLLLQRGANVSYEEIRWEPLTAASKGGHHDMVELLIDKGADFNTINRDGRAPLHYAAEGGHAAVVKVLVEKGAAIDLIDAYGSAPLLNAATCGHEAVVRVLIQKGADVDTSVTIGDSCWSTPLSSASERGYENIVKLLIEGGADVNNQDGHGDTALHFASKAGHLDVVRFLIENGAEVNIQNSLGETACRLASRERYMDVVKALDDAGEE